MSEPTKQKILAESLRLFSERGYDSVSVQDIASAVGIKAPSLYNHYKSKEKIFEALMKTTLSQYDEFTAGLSVHVGAPESDSGVFTTITADDLVEKVKNIFTFTFKDEQISQFRKMMSIEQFRTPELSIMYNQRFVDRMISYHKGIFEGLIAAGRLKELDAGILALTYVSPVITLLGVCDREPERFDECLEQLEKHVRLFFYTFNK